MIVKTIMDDVIFMKNDVFEDSRGYFIELYNQEIFQDYGIKNNFIQDNLSFSKKINTIRGLHYQKPPFEQSKFISLISGSIQDIFVDTRINSNNFGKYDSIILDKPGDSIYIPQGYLHGFCTLSENTIIKYKVDNFYNPKSELGVLWNDKELSINWNISNENPILSKKDSELLSWTNFIKDLKV
tara:strand:+ start:190 stop:741 length:552 start_codon:yes stop_codon:yes gene_type:complete